MSNGEFRRTAVDHSSAPHAMSRTYSGVSGLRALRTSACAHMSMWPKQIDGSAIRAEVWPTAARKGIYD